MTSRLSRFDHLEKPRADSGTIDHEASLKRFEKETEPQSAPGVDANEVPVPESSSERRFSDDVAVQGSSDADVPFRRCPRCNVDESKFQDLCTICGFDLLSDEGRTATAERLRELNDHITRTAQPSHAEHAALAPVAQSQEVKPAPKNITQQAEWRRRRIVRWAAAAVCGGLALVVPYFWVKVLLILMLAVFTTRDDWRE